jgi:hypothetical protein
MTDLCSNESADEHQMQDQINDQMTYRAEMGFTHRELLNGLPNAVVPYTVSRKNDLTYLIAGDNRVVTLHLSPEKTRKIAAITLPITNIVIEFKNFDAVQHQQFLDRFHKYMHRGGG